MKKTSLRTKLFLVLTLLPIAALGGYLVLALQLFRDDKIAYVFESEMNRARLLSIQARAELLIYSTAARSAAAAYSPATGTWTDAGRYFASTALQTVSPTTVPTTSPSSAPLATPSSGTAASKSSLKRIAILQRTDPEESFTFKSTYPEQAGELPAAAQLFGLSPEELDELQTNASQFGLSVFNREPVSNGSKESGHHARIFAFYLARSGSSPDTVVVAEFETKVF
ncbi:MAG: hypothetical protein EOP09_13760, partial [Proteobacteria bacterium]